jgi:two-component system sensor histidine kinase/response regulator
MSLAFRSLIAKLKSLALRQFEGLRNPERLDLLRGSVEGLWDWDMRSDQVQYSPRFRELLGYSGDEPLLKSMIAIHPEDREQVADALRRHFLERTPIELELRLRCKDGEYRWFRGRAQAAWDPRGTPLRCVGSVADVGDYKESAQRVNDAIDTGHCNGN